MEREYKTAKIWAIFLYITAPALIALFVYLGILPFLKDEINWMLVFFLIPVSTAMIALMIFGVISVTKGRLIIKDDKIISVELFDKKELKLSEIRGFTLEEKYIFIEPNNKENKRIKVSEYLSGYKEILNWLCENYEDLKTVNAQTEENEILDNEDFGITKRMRKENLSKAKKISLVINLLGAVSGAWVFFYPKPFDCAMLSAVIIPVIALIIIKLSRGLIRIDKKDKSIYPTVIYAFVFPSCALLAKTLLKYQIFDYSNVWPIAAAITIIFLFLLLIKQKEITFKKKQDFITAVSLSLFLFMYGFASAIYINCGFDKSKPEHFTAKILEKETTGDDNTKYHLKLSSWGPKQKTGIINVDIKLYNRIKIDDDINIYLSKGKFNIPWYIVSDK